MKHLAQIRNPVLEPPSGGINDPIGFLQAFLPKLITITLIVAAIVFLFIMLWGGISWITAGGDKAQVEQARARITNALVGITIVFTVFAIATFVEAVFGIDLLDVDLSVITL